MEAHTGMADMYLVGYIALHLEGYKLAAKQKH